MDRNLSLYEFVVDREFHHNTMGTFFLFCDRRFILNLFASFSPALRHFLCICIPAWGDSKEYSTLVAFEIVNSFDPHYAPTNNSPFHATLLQLRKPAHPHSGNTPQLPETAETHLHLVREKRVVGGDGGIMLANLLDEVAAHLLHL